MSSAVAVDAGVLDDVQYWRRQISPKIPSYWVYTKPIQKSQQDDREYRLIRLDNGLQAMLVHDAKADKAAASLDVAVGHLHDPVSTLFLLSWVWLTRGIRIGRHARACAFLRASVIHGAYYSKEKIIEI